MPSVTSPSISITELHQRSLQTSTSRRTFPLGFTSDDKITQEDIVCIRCWHCRRFIFKAAIRMNAVNAHHWDDCTDRVTRTPCTRAITCSECLHPRIIFKHLQKDIKAQTSGTRFQLTNFFTGTSATVLNKPQMIDALLSNELVKSITTYTSTQVETLFNGERRAGMSTYG